ncbi:hypothetical protein HELRODRAFT_164882 [Helobdella robusta]|uniref:Uncharacterized protein n=1 Tax=Helobdella robusta TaxID=6412 RepID=T1EVW8_HELRO|nr:hypothetical protein HELRODRAFT_164882 [Helobdella robusta]ESN92770.1 hypothetical protein HELRODRAFT_164882 [Helobdella robusta]
MYKPTCNIQKLPIVRLYSSVVQLISKWQPPRVMKRSSHMVGGRRLTIICTSLERNMIGRHGQRISNEQLAKFGNETCITTTGKDDITQRHNEHNTTTLWYDRHLDGLLKTKHVSSLSKPTKCRPTNPQSSIVSRQKNLRENLSYIFTMQYNISEVGTRKSRYNVRNQNVTT